MQSFSKAYEKAARDYYRVVSQTQKIYPPLIGITVILGITIALTINPFLGLGLMTGVPSGLGLIFVGLFLKRLFQNPEPAINNDLVAALSQVENFSSTCQNLNFNQINDGLIRDANDEKATRTQDQGLSSSSLFRHLNQNSTTTPDTRSRSSSHSSSASDDTAWRSVDSKTENAFTV